MSWRPASVLARCMAILLSAPPGHASGGRPACWTWETDYGGAFGVEYYAQRATGGSRRPPDEMRQSEIRILQDHRKEATV